MGGAGHPVRADSIRFRVWSVLRAEPEPARAIALRAGLEYKATVDALYALHVLELVERVGRKAKARWRAQTDAEAEAGARRRANARAWGAGAGGEG